MTLNSLDNNKIANLYLRSNDITDEMVEQIAKKIKVSTSLLAFDISKNKITGKSILSLCDALDRNRSLQYLGLAMNELTGTDVMPLLNALGSNSFPQENSEEQLKKMKDRDAIIEKNKKLKGKKEEPVPFVENIVNQDGVWIIQKNLELKQLNLGLNNFDDSVQEFVDKMLTKTPSTFSMFVSGKALSKDLMKTLSTKHGSKFITQ